MLKLELILYIKSTADLQKYIQHVTLQVSLNILQIRTDSNTCLSTLKWKTDQAELSPAVLHFCPSNASYSQGEAIKYSFISLFLSHWYHWLCRPNPVKSTPCGVKNTQKFLQLNRPNWTSFGWQPNSSDLSYPEILTGALNREGREDKTYKLNLKNHIHRVVNPTLTNTLSNGGYRIKYRVAGRTGCYHGHPGAGLASW